MKTKSVKFTEIPQRPISAAITQRRSLQISDFESITSRSQKDQQHISATSLSPGSLQRLREKQKQEREDMLNNKYPSLHRESQHLRISKDLAEYDNCSDAFEKEIHINPDEYEKFRRNLSKIVFDAQGNYLYTKVDQQNPEVKKGLGLTMSNRYNSKKILQAINKRQNNFQPKTTINEMAKNAQKEAAINSRKETVAMIKLKSEQTLVQIIQNGAKDKILAESKRELQKTSTLMNNEIDKFIKENDQLKEEIEKCKNIVVELQAANDNINFKNQILQQEINTMKNKYEDLIRSTENLQTFVSQFKSLNAKFPNFSAEKVIHRYEYFENLCLNQGQKISDFEIQKIEQEKYLSSLQNVYEDKYQKLIQDDDERKKNIALYLTAYEEKENQLKNVLQYKELYLKLFNRVGGLYNQWKNKISVFSKVDQGPYAKIDDPIEMLNVMERMIEISTDEKMQSYLRKIIVSANLLQRKYLPEFVNHQFDADLIFERILKLVDSLQRQLNKITNEYTLLKRQVRKEPKSEIESNKGNKEEQMKEYIN